MTAAGTVYAPVGGVRIDRLSVSDLSMLLPDEMGWPQDIGAIGILEPAADEDAEALLRRVRATIASRLHLVPRFRQIVVSPRLGLGVPYWTDVDAFDVSDHVQIRALEDDAGDAQVLAAFEHLRVQRFDMSRPLWQLWLLPGLRHGRVALIVKLHHVLADGMSGLAQVMTLLDVAPKRELTEAPTWTPGPSPTRSQLLLENLHRRAAEVAHGCAAVLRPWRLIKAWRRWRAFIREVWRRPSAPQTSLQQRIGQHRKLALLRCELSDIKAVAHAHDAKINDVLLALLAAGARAVLEHRGESTDHLTLRVSVPISKHAQHHAARGNQDAGMLVDVPVSRRLDDATRLRTIAKDTAVRKRQPRPTFNVSAFPGSVWVLRRMLRGMATQRLANLYAADVPGPPMPMYLAGARILELFPVIPLNGNVTIALGALSYAGKFGMIAVTDANACPDIDVFVEAVKEAFVRYQSISNPSLGATEYS